MIVLTTLKGENFALNEELIERVEADPETRVILTSGTRYIVAEPVTEVVRRVRLEHAETQVLAKHLDARARQLSVAAPPGDAEGVTGDVLPFGRAAGRPGPSGSGHLNPR